MTAKSWTLTDIDQGIYEDKMSIGPDDVGGTAQGYSISKRRLSGGLQQGVDIIEVDNGTLKFTVIPTRGMGLGQAQLGGHRFGWNSPVRGPVHPSFVCLYDPGGLGWLDGFDELMVRCGLESNGAPDFDDDGKLTYPLHGKIANRPAHKVEVSVDGDSGEITITGVVDEVRFHFQKLRLTTTIKTRVGEPGLRIHDQISNLSGSDGEMQILYHTNFGPPLLDAGAQFVAPTKIVVPRNAHAAESVRQWDHYLAEQPGFEEQVYFLELLGDEDGNTQTLLKNAHGTLGASTLFNKKQLPCYTVWKNTTAAADGYVTGLEPGVNFPNPISYEKQQNRTLSIAPGTSREFDLELRFHADAASITAAEKVIAKLQGAGEAKVYDKPQPGWCGP